MTYVAHLSCGYTKKRMSNPEVRAEDKTKRREHAGPSWGLMLAAIFFAMLVAMGIAWWMIAPYVKRLH